MLVLTALKSQKYLLRFLVDIFTRLLPRCSIISMKNLFCKSFNDIGLLNLELFQFTESIKFMCQDCRFRNTIQYHPSMHTRLLTPISNICLFISFIHSNLCVCPSSILWSCPNCTIPQYYFMSPVLKKVILKSYICVWRSRLDIWQFHYFAINLVVPV